jgi:hypothetical protein
MDAILPVFSWRERGTATFTLFGFLLSIGICVYVCDAHSHMNPYEAIHFYT